jgi:hypothetical protein
VTDAILGLSSPGILLILFPSSSVLPSRVFLLYTDALKAVGVSSLISYSPSPTWEGVLILLLDRTISSPESLCSSIILFRFLEDLPLFSGILNSYSS